MAENIALKMADGPVKNPFSGPNITEDVVLVVEGRKLHVSKAILGVVSPVFEKMFYENIKNRKQLRLSGKKYDEMVEFLLGIYPSKMKKVSKETVEAVMMLADEYQVQHIIEDCTQFLTNGDIKFKVYEMVHFLHITEHKVQLQKVFDYSLDEVARNYHFKDRRKKDEYDELSPETKMKVLMARVCYLENIHKYSLFKR